MFQTEAGVASDHDQPVKAILILKKKTGGNQLVVNAQH